MFQTILVQPLVNALVILTTYLGSLGGAIIILTVLIRILLLPLSLPSLRSAQKIKDLNPELQALQKKYAKDKQKLAQAQMELYRREGINPAAGCLPTIIQFIILIALYQVFIKALGVQGGENLSHLLYPGVSLPPNGVNLNFLYLDLGKPDVIAGFVPGFFLILSALFQFLTTRLTMPAVSESQKVAQKTAAKNDDMMVMMQKQMVYMMPVMTIFIGYTLPAGVTLYWWITSLFSFLQQWVVMRLMKKGVRESND
ncbi:YidC/Oxa1 family membrane protein insertase [Candidatus Shapirobacteria bacterium]|nr:YidC/Oxa1 family membrane protein insertase [Candidatus Shapirobacteria bacterium]